MDRNLTLEVLGEIMGWPIDGDKATDEYRWLTLMSKFKYDNYSGFQPGVRFIENLVYWLLQFDKKDREAAYSFIRGKLVYISSKEMLKLVSIFYPEYVEPFLVKKTAEKLSVRRHHVWVHESAKKQLERLRRKTLFVGLSDGAKMDEFRRSNIGVISNEQVIVTPQVDDEKWRDLLKELRKDKENYSSEERFSSVFLVDDFTASGTSLIRYSKNEETGASRWKGKMEKFFSTIARVEEDLGEKVFEDDWEIHVHHHLATHQAAKGDNRVEVRYRNAIASGGVGSWHSRINFTFGHILPINLPLTSGPPDQFLELAKSDKYYNQVLNENPHNKEGGVVDIRLGYAECALPLILEHNTPNNSLPLIWAETPGSIENKIHEMRPLFFRRQRHT